LSSALEINAGDHHQGCRILSALLVGAPQQPTPKLLALSSTTRSYDR
jgi:hypothetical protein